MHIIGKEQLQANLDRAPDEKGIENIAEAIINVLAHTVPGEGITQKHARNHKKQWHPEAEKKYIAVFQGGIGIGTLISYIGKTLKNMPVHYQDNGNAPGIIYPGIPCAA